MLFNSIEFLFIFLPATVLAYYFLVSRNQFTLSKFLLVCASLFFYSWWKIEYLPIMLISIILNFAIGQRITISSKPKLYLALGVTANLLALAYFKYADFFISNLNFAVGTEFSHLKILLPLAISFFTFQQVSYLVDVYKDRSIKYNILDYSLFVSFFPQLIAGPIVHHKEILPQLLDKTNSIINWENLNRGMYIFGIGLFKKVILADTFASWVAVGYAGIDNLGTFDAWATLLGYTLQIYFDFSGYTDMAIGAALFFNIRLPFNFNSPYKAINIQDFWRRWHITLGRWFRDYVYIPLGGNKVANFKIARNLFLTAFVSGIWHGAGWNFVLWGSLHGAAMVAHMLWKKGNINLNPNIGRVITFLFVMLTWVTFRSIDFNQSMQMYSKLFVFGASGFELFDISMLAGLAIGLVIVLLAPNSLELAGFAEKRINPSLTRPAFAYAISTIIFVSLISSMSMSYTEFIYFNF